MSLRAESGLRREQAAIEPHALAATHFLLPGHRIYIGSGIIKKVSGDRDGVDVGDEVIFLASLEVIEPDSNPVMLDESQLREVESSLVIAKPTTLAFSQAVCLSSAFLSAITTICSIVLGIPYAQLFSQDDRRALLLLGNTTPFAKAIVQVLRIARPNLFIMTTIGPFEREVEEDELSAMAIELVQLGANYTIEHKAEDLVNHLRAALRERGEEEGEGEGEGEGEECGEDDIEFIINGAGVLDGREAELRDLLLPDEEGRIVKISDEDLFRLSSIATPSELRQIMAMLDRLLQSGDFQAASFTSELEASVLMKR
ncbi:hypothetical protein KC318_g5602 [Hortaea werneckii]|nr:hypothetical protein KC334_g6365 [Hortaea werneckii]KAI7010410.1 hypothetical protein KC355_g6193 [Hortaea werneckii]KAI7667856.1 hypothetical protein KC318_g5602 [Hortaea werneckii]